MTLDPSAPLAVDLRASGEVDFAAWLATGYNAGMKYSLRNVTIVVLLVVLATAAVEVIREYAFGHRVSVQSVGLTLGVFALFGRLAVSYLRSLSKGP